MEGLTGQAFGPYQITEKIGEGGMAVVYKGYQPSLNRYVAIKVLREEMSHDEQLVTRFRREALAVAELHHPNILHVYDAGFAQGVYYIVMAYVDGGSLKELITRGSLEVDRAVSIGSQLADALHHAHELGLVHRDVKPSNVLMTREGRPLLCDFGIAKAVNESVGLTRTGTAIGTPEYMAPEQVQGQKVDARTDIYAMGLVLYEMLTGWVPFSATTPMATLYKQVNEPPPPLTQSNVSVPDWLEQVVEKALAKRPSDRFQHANEMANALRKGGPPVKRRTPAPVPVAKPAPTTSGGKGAGRSKLLPILIIGIVLLLLALLIGGILLTCGGPPGPPPVITEVVPRG
jgi:serine/threonine-protein kinase